jgi:hypothetical protein
MFVMKGYTPETVNTYDCSECKEKGVPHEVIEVPGPPTTSASCWGAGIPTTFRECTACGFRDGGWVSSDIVGGGW